MADVTGQAPTSPQFTYKFSSGFLSGQNLPIGLPNRQLTAAFKAAGVAADQLNRIHPYTYTFAASVAQTIDLTALPDPLGNPFALARVKVLLIRINATVDAASLVLGAAGTNEWTGLLSVGGTLTLRAGTLANDGHLIVVAPNTTGYPVTATSRLLKMTPSAHAFTCDIIVAGCDA